MSPLFAFTMGAMSILSADVETGKLLGLALTSALYEIDIDTGLATLIAPLSDDPSEGGLAVGPDGTLYAAFSGTIGQLAMMDPETGEYQFIGPFGFADVSGLAFGTDGTLYGFDDATDHLITVDTLTGVGSDVGYMGEVGGGGLAVTPDGTLYFAGFVNLKPNLWTLNTATGEKTLVGPFNIAANTTDALESIGNDLYASCFSTGTGHKALVSVDRYTGQATVIGCFSDGCTLDIGGLAFLPGPGDADRDGDVDYDDFLFFEECFGNLDEPGKSPYCAFLDSDKDGDIDCDDWEDFIPNWTEETEPPTFPTCDGCEGDANEDGTVDPLDSGWVLARFGCAVGTGDPECDAADQNADGTVDPLDVGYVQARFGECL